ncbi:MAG: IclR family transcriptional regulator [Acidimicrobiales bacterium]
MTGAGLVTPMGEGDTSEYAPSGRVPGRSMAEKVICVLEALAAGQEGIGVREAARLNHLDKSAVSRLLDQFARLGLAEKDLMSGRFHSGPRLFALGATVHSRDTLWLAAEPILRELVGRFNETCYLTVRDGDVIVFREKIDCNHHVRYVIESHERVPINGGAGGRAVLSGLSGEELGGALGRVEMVKLTEQTLTDRDALRRQVEEDRRRGYAVSRGERTAEGSAIAAPYFAGNGSCRGSVVFSCPKVRFGSHDVPEVAEAVVGAARQLSTRLGYHPAEVTDEEGRS